MSAVTNILLHIDLDTANRIEEVNEFFSRKDLRGWPPLVSLDDPRLPRGWYGGDKRLEADIYVGAYNHFELQSFIEYLQSIAWRDDDAVQLFVKEYDEMEFKLITISRCEAD